MALEPGGDGHGVVSRAATLQEEGSKALGTRRGKRGRRTSGALNLEHALFPSFVLESADERGGDDEDGPLTVRGRVGLGACWRGSVDDILVAAGDVGAVGRGVERGHGGGGDGGGGGVVWESYGGGGGGGAWTELWSGSGTSRGRDGGTAVRRRGGGGGKEERKKEEGPD